jgi:hypothetical protein
MRHAALLPFVLAVSACTPPVLVPEADQHRVATEFDGSSRFLRVAMYAAPFFSDDTKVLLTDAPVGELELLETPDGKPITPPPASRVLPPGTPARVVEVQFPTGWVVASRVMMTPRYNPWLLVTVPGDARPHVIVLGQGASSAEAVRAEIDRVLSLDDPTAALQALPAEQRQAIVKKELIEGMGPRGVEMSWGQPERKRIDRPARTEEWSWTGGKRRAFFEDEKLVRWQKG